MDPPHLTQGLHHRQVPRCCGCGWPLQSFQQENPICPDLPCQRHAFVLTFGQVVFFDAPSITLKPGRLCDGTQPIWYNRCQVIKGRAQRFGHQFQQGQIVHGGQHVRAVGALLATGLE
jgi:hypothetical protein